MFSFGPLSYANHLLDYFNASRNRKLFVILKYELYKFVLYSSILRQAVAVYFMLTDPMGEDFRQIDPFSHFLTYELFDRNVYMAIAFISFLFYKVGLGDTLLYDMSSYASGLYANLRYLQTALRLHGVKHSLWGKNEVFEQIMPKISSKVAPFMRTKNRMRWVRLVFTVDQYVHYFVELYFFENFFSVFIFYKDHVRPLNLSLFWSVEYCLDASLALLYTFNIIRQSMFLVTYAVYIIPKFIWQMAYALEKLKKQLGKEVIHESNLRHALYKCHLIYISVLLDHIELNTKIIKKFYLKTVTTNLICNLSIIVSFALESHRPIFDWPLRIILFLQVGMIIIVGMCFASSTDALIAPSPTVYTTMIAFRKCRHREIKLHTRIMSFYEIIHHKRCFRFEFGALGRITKRNLLSFWGFYFGLLFKAISDLVIAQ